MQTVMKKDKMFTEETAEYDKVVSDLILGADTQLTQLETAKKEVEKVYKENKVIATDKNLYDKEKAETDKIKNEKAKKELSDKVAKVKEAIETKEKEEAEKKASETPTEATEQSVNTAVGETNGNNDSATYTPTNEATYGAEENTYTPSWNTGGGATNTANGGSTSNGGGQATTPPASGGGNSNAPSYPEYDTGHQSGNSNWGGTWEGGWSEVN